MKTTVLTAYPRDTIGRGVRDIRTSGRIPAVMYGRGIASQNLELDYNDFVRVLDTAGESTLVDLKVEGGETTKVLIQDVHLHPVTDRVIHTDFRRVDLTHKIEAEILLEFVGIPPAVKELGGVFVGAINSVIVKGLPQDLVHEISIDVSVLAKIDDKIYVRDLVIPDSLELLTESEILVATVEAARTEEEVTAAAETTTEDEEKSAIEAQEPSEEKGKDEEESGDTKEEEKK